MADDEADASTNSEGEGKSGGGAMGPALALILLVVFGVAIAWTMWTVFFSDDGGTQQEEGTGQSYNLLEDCVSVPLPGITTNVGNEQGLRYSKVDVQIWVLKDDLEKVSREDMAPIMREVIEERLHTFSMKELKGEYIHTKLRTTFKDVLNNKLRSVFGTENTDREYVKEVVLTNLLTQ